MKRKNLIFCLLVITILAALTACSERGDTHEDEVPTVETQEPEAPQFPDNPEGQPDVNVDWSVLEPYSPVKPIYTRVSDNEMTELKPSENYGPIIPFQGDRLGGQTEFPRYGLVTLYGEIVMDPVLSQVWDGGTESGYYDLEPLPYYMLCKETPAQSQDGTASEVWAMAAKDGSWCTDFKYIMDGETTLWGRSTTQNCSENGIFLGDGDDLVYLSAEDGRELFRVKDIPDEIGIYMALFGAGWAGDRPYIRNYGSQGWWIDQETGSLTPTDQLPGTDPVVDGKYVNYNYEDSSYTVYDESGNKLLTAGGISRITWDGGDQFVVYENTQNGWETGYLVSAVYNAATMDRVDSPAEGHNVFFGYGTGSGWCWYIDGEDTVFIQGARTVRVTVPGRPSAIMGAMALFSDYEDDNKQYLVNLNTGGVLSEGLLYVNSFYSYDMATGELYYITDTGRETRLFDENGDIIAAASHAPSERVALAGDMLFITGDSQVILRHIEGDTVFRYILPAGEWD